MTTSIPVLTKLGWVLKLIIKVEKLESHIETLESRIVALEQKSDP